MESKMQEVFKNNIKIISFHTDDAFYSSMAKKLEQSCLQFELKYQIEKIQSKGSWVFNCAYKSNFILDKLSEEKENDCIIWVDSDAQIVKYPELLFSTQNDFGIRAEPGGRTKKPSKREAISLPSNWPTTVPFQWFNSGTMFFRKVPTILEMINQWISIQSGTNKWDQWSLQEAWCNVQPKTEWFPREYCQIKKIHKEKGAVILHELASVIQKVNRK